jgi:hypothetical protein
MACQYLHPNGSQNQNHSKRCGCDCCYHLASQGFWSNPLPHEYTRIKMNVKRIFGGLLTVLGIGGLIYAAIVFVNISGGSRNIRTLIIFGLLGIIFFIAGISLIRTTKDES